MKIIWCMVPERACDEHNFLSFWTVFCPFTPLTTQNLIILEKWKNAWRYYHFKQVYHKWQSYDVWFLRYEVWRTEFFVILDCFLPFYPHNNPKNQNFEKLKKQHMEISSFYASVTKIMIICYTALYIWRVTM